MPTLTGSGRSTSPNTLKAAAEAVAQARRTLGGKPPQFGLVFAGPDHPLPPLMSAAREAAGGAGLVGCTTAGEFTEEGLTHNGVAVLLVASDDTQHLLAFSTGLKQQHERVAEELTAGFSKAHADAQSHRRLASTTVLLTDGLAGTAERSLGVLSDRTGFAQQIVGGAAGDEGRFKETSVAAGTRTGSDAVAALHVFSAKTWGVGLGHGLRPASPRMRVTRASGNVLHQIDGRPAFDIYKEHAAGRGIPITASDAGPYMIGNELGLFLFDHLNRARAPLGVNADGSLNLAADVPEGASVCILDGEPENMVAAAHEAAREAQRRLEGGRAAGVAVFDCVCRGMILKDRFTQEIDAVRRVFGDVPVAGFLTYGEIARYGGKLDGWHNTTAVVVAIPA